MPDRHPRVLFVGHGAERTGPPVFLLHFQRWLAAEASTSFATTLVRGGELLDEYRRLGPVAVLDPRWTAPRVVQAGLGRVGRSAWSDRLRARRYKSRLGRLPDRDVIYMNTASPGCVEAVRQVAGRVPLVSHIHELEVGLRYHLPQADLRFVLGATDRFIAASQAVADNLIRGHGVAAERVAVHHEFIDTSERPSGSAGARRASIGIPEGAPVVGASGMTDWRKAPDLFVRLAWELAQRGRDDVHFVWVGGDTRGPNWWPLDHDIRHLGLEGRVHFLGPRPDPLDDFALCDVFVLPSREDAFPLACLEAAALGVPIVCFDNGGMPEFVAAADAGAVVPYPRVDAMADAVVGLLADDAGRRAAGARGRDRVRERHDVSRAAPALYDEIRRVA